MISDVRHLKTGYHTCLLYTNKAEQMAVAVPFFKEGLTRRECCVYVADDQTTGEVEAAFHEQGIDVRGLGEQGALQVLTKYDTFLRYARFEPSIMIEFMDKLVNKSIQQGFAGLRFASEMTWALNIGCEGLVEYEALLNTWHPKWRLVTICQYNRARFTAQIQRDVLKTHPLAILGDKVLPNMYYEPPDLFLGQKPEAARVEWMVANLKRGQPLLNGGRD
jgi:hypothetical protein